MNTNNTEIALVRLTAHAERTRKLELVEDRELNRTARALCRVLAARAIDAGADPLTVALLLDYAGVEAPIPYRLADYASPVNYWPSEESA